MRILTIIFVFIGLTSFGQSAKKLLLSQATIPYTSDTFLVSDTWTCPEGVTEVTVICIGGGGSGGYASSTGVTGGGGGGGAFAQNTVTVIEGRDYYIYIGAGGESTTSSSSNGGNTAFVDGVTYLSPCAAYGGSAGSSDGTGGLGGNGSLGYGTTLYSGGNGSDSDTGYSGGGGGAAGTTGTGGSASVYTAGEGADLLGGDGATGITIAGNAGNDGSVYGGGGSGGYYNGTNIKGGDGADGIVIISYGSKTQSPVQIVNVSDIGQFQILHSLITDGTYLYGGERINDATPDSIARIIKFDINTLDEIDAYEVGANLDVESMCYDSINDVIYATKYNLSQLEIMEINPATMELIGSVHTYPSILPGASPSIVTDGSFIYGVTYRDPAVFFKINVSTWGSATNTWTNGERGHATRIDVNNGYMYASDLPYSTSTNPYFAKVSLSNLSYSEISIGDYVRKATDDMAMINTGAEVYCYLVGESLSGVESYGGVRVKISDLTVTGITLKTSYSLYEYQNDVYSATIDGNVQVFDGTDLNVSTYYLDGFNANEIMTINNRGFMANFQSYIKSLGKLFEFSLR